MQYVMLATQYEIADDAASYAYHAVCSVSTKSIRHYNLCLMAYRA